jgi:hypothetical protein
VPTKVTAAGASVLKIDKENDAKKDGLIEAPRTKIEPVSGLDVWPAQFNPQNGWNKAGFLYAIEEPMFAKLSNKEQLNKACKEHNIPSKDVAYWERRPLKHFRAWMENVMAGRKSEKERGLTPFFQGKNPKKFTETKGKKAATKQASLLSVASKGKKAAAKHKSSPSTPIKLVKNATTQRKKESTNGWRRSERILAYTSARRV